MNHGAVYILFHLPPKRILHLKYNTDKKGQKINVMNISNSTNFGSGGVQSISVVLQNCFLSAMQKNYSRNTVVVSPFKHFYIVWVGLKMLSFGRYRYSAFEQQTSDKLYISCRKLSYYISS